jgi:hypothetical protein
VTLRWPWIAALAALIAIGLLLSWADSTMFRPLFPVPFEPPRRVEFRPAVVPELPPPLEPGRRGFTFNGLGPAGGLFTFWWFLSTAAAAILLTLAALVALPARVRRAAERVSPASLSFMFAGGIATALLGLAASALLRLSFVLLSFVVLVWGLALFGAIFGLAALALALGRWLRSRLGPVPPLLAALAGLLVVIDVALVPWVGWLVLAVAAVTSLGLAVLTRLGSSTGWTLEDLNW